MRASRLSGWACLALFELAGGLACEYTGDSVRITVPDAVPVCLPEGGIEMGVDAGADGQMPVDMADAGSTEDRPDTDGADAAAGDVADDRTIPDAGHAAGSILARCGPAGRGCTQTCLLEADAWTCGDCVRDGRACEASAPDAGSEGTRDADADRTCACDSCCQPRPGPDAAACDSCCPRRDPCPEAGACNSCCTQPPACPDAGMPPSTTPTAVPCQAGNGACLRHGVGLLLPDGGSSCTVEAGAPEAVETCDGIDNDCDGDVDEGFRRGEPCTVGRGPCARTGRFVCASDGQSAVCDAPVVPGVPEICGDGADNDCDGIVDDGCSTNCPMPATCEPIRLDVQTAEVDEGPPAGRCSATQCSTLSSGATCGGSGWSMGLCLNTCPTGPPFPWTQCRFRNVNLNRFDADNGNAGTLEVKFCLTQPMRGGLSLWYGEYPRRKKMMLFGDAERIGGLAPGCYTKYFRPGSAACGNFGSTENVDLPVACRRLNWICPDGRWTSEGAICQFNYDNVPLWLTAEDCVPGFSVNTAVENINIRYYPEGCDCQPGAACGDGRTCQSTSYLYHLTSGVEAFGSTNICRATE